MLILAFVALLSISLVHGQCVPQFFSNDEWIPDNKTGLFGGDMRFTKEQLYHLRLNKYNLITSSSWQRWATNGKRGAVIPYTISDQYTSSERKLILESMADMQAATNNCVKFVERTDQKDHYLMIMNLGGCWAYVGRLNSPQEVSIGNDCLVKGGIQHEILHSLGFWHEQNRPDRDQYIKIHWDNIDKNSCSFYQKVYWPDMAYWDQPYDLESVMHYPSWAGAYKGEAFTVKDKSKADRVGQREGMSKIDIKELNLLHNC